MTDLPAQIEAVQKDLHRSEHWVEHNKQHGYAIGAEEAHSLALRAVLAALQQRERLEAAARGFLRWWDFHGMDRNFEYIGLKVGLLRAALDTAAPETLPDMPPINPSEGASDG